MAIYRVQQRVGIEPPEWFITIADDRAPGVPVPLLDAGAFATEEAALALAEKLNREQVRQ